MELLEKFSNCGRDIGWLSDAVEHSSGISGDLDVDGAKTVRRICIVQGGMIREGKVWGSDGDKIGSNKKSEVDWDGEERKLLRERLNL